MCFILLIKNYNKKRKKKLIVKPHHIFNGTCIMQKKKKAKQFIGFQMRKWNKVNQKA